MNFITTLRVWSILLLAAGYGWAGGHFIPADAPLVAYIFQFCMLGILFALAITFLKALTAHRAASSLTKRAVTGLTIYAILTLIINIANIVHGIKHTDRYGFHGTLADTIPIVLIIAGDLTWLLTIRRRPSQDPQRPALRNDSSKA